MAGDFNLTLNNEIDRKGSCYNHQKSAELINKYMDTLNFNDIWRTLHPDTRQFTWMRNKPRLHYARLDFILCSDSLVSRVKEAAHAYGFSSDHSAVTMSILSDLPKRGPGFWKINSTLTLDRNFITTIKELITAAKSKYRLSNPGIKWEMVKCEKNVL